MLQNEWQPNILDRLYQIMFKIIILSQIVTDRYQKHIFEILLLSPPFSFLQWWSIADVSQQGLHFKKKISKIFFFYLTFTDVNMGHQKVPKSDFQRHCSMSKIIWIFLIFFSLKNISLEEGFLLLSYFEIFNF